MDESAVSYQVVLTKADKISAAEEKEVLERTREALRRRPAAHPEVILTSSQKADGLTELRTAIATLIAE